MPTGNGVAAFLRGRSGRPMPLGNFSMQPVQPSHLTKKHASSSTRRNVKITGRPRAQTRRVRTACCFFFLAFGLVMAATLPLTTSDISLMLRSGYSVSTIEAELATRHFADQLDEGKRNQLIKAGATTELLDAIESGNFSVPKDKLEKSRRKMEDQAHDRALLAEQAKRNDTLYQNQLLKQRARLVTQGSADAIAGAAKGNLVRLQNGNL